jgi:hypothetical protein
MTAWSGTVGSNPNWLKGTFKGAVAPPQEHRDIRRETVCCHQVWHSILVEVCYRYRLGPDL